MDKWKGRALGSILFDSEMITQEHIERALAEQRRSGVRFGEALVKLGIITTEDLNWGLAQQFNIPFVHIRLDAIDPEAVRIVPEDIARRYNLLPYLLIGDELTIIIEDPTVKRAIADVESITGKHVTIGVGLPQQIEIALNEVYGKNSKPGQAGDDFISDMFTPEQLEAIHNDYTSESFLSYLFETAHEKHVSSVHFDPRNENVVIRFRMDGKLIQAAQLSRAWARGAIQRLKTSLCYTQHRKGMLEGFCNLDVSDEINIYHATFVDTPNGESVTLINMTAYDMAHTLPELIEDKNDLQTLEEMLARRNGILFLLGTDRLEKFRFLEMLLDAKDAQNRKTILIGRLPYFVNMGFTQLRPADERWEEVLETLKFSFSQDPDLLVLEDITQMRLLNATLPEAMMPRFFLGNLRFPSVLSGLEFLTEAAESRTLLCNATLGLVAFGMFHQLCPACKQPDDRMERTSKILGVPRTELDKATIMRSMGCEECNGLGFKGNKHLVELLPFDEPLVSLLKSGEPFDKLMPSVEGMQTNSLAAQARDLVMQGLIGVDEYANVLGINRHGAN